MSSVTLSSKGQVTLPSELRHLLGLQAGDQLLAEEHDGAVVLRPLRHKDFFEACNASAKIYQGKAVSMEAMKGAWGQAAAERHQKGTA